MTTTRPYPTLAVGSFDLTGTRDDHVRRMSRAPARTDARAHPIFAFVGALGGLPLPIKDLSTSLGLDFDAGPVLARCQIAVARPLLVDRVYTVTPQIDRIERKPSRRYGHADHLHLKIALDDDTPFTTIALHIIFPAEDAAT
ncbi:hypothetical protein [Maritimibacter alexandrii]|uniref:hypothetical protein n=1 Tax=Maritimibacter alexandrii TaxID=2570355 RepID=UPI001108BA2F|nr:hypothetical protein [Maritimibacter alexandrii]